MEWNIYKNLESNRRNYSNQVVPENLKNNTVVQRLEEVNYIPIPKKD